MTASATSKTAVDGVQTPFPAGMALESVSGNFIQTTYIKEPVGEGIVSVAQDGTDGTGITAPAGGLGIRGWLSGVYKLLSNPLAIFMSGSQVTVTPTVTASTYTGGFVAGGVQNFAGVLSSNNMGKLQSITLRFKGSVQTSACNVAIFSTTPAGTFNDHAAPVIAAADSAILLGVYQFAASTGKSVLGSSQTIYNMDNIGKKIIGVTTSLFAVVTITTTTTNAFPTNQEMSLTLAVDW
jgi:hypothetical protein